MTADHGLERLVTRGAMARIEGEASVRIRIRDGELDDVELNIFEPPRYFEALLAGRQLVEAPDITSRICGICPVAYQITACAAAEDATQADPGEAVWALRRLLYCAEWIQSHALHIYLLHAPDFLGCADAAELAERDRETVERGLALKRTGNLVMKTIGGRAIHPVNVKVGGFYHAPPAAEILALREPLERARDAALQTVEWVAGFEFPDVRADYRFVALRTPGAYPIERGRPASSDGLDLSPAAFDELVEEEHVPHSTALHARLRGIGTYLTGPLARYALNSSLLSPLAAEAAAGAGLQEICRNPFQSIVVRAVELVFACDEALALVERYVPPDPPGIEPSPVVGIGVGVTEAPRGLLLHSYEADPDGTIRKARILPPTSQNQLSIEADVRRAVEATIQGPEDELLDMCERAVRNHDPCISCSAHFLDLTVDRR